MKKKLLSTLVGLFFAASTPLMAQSTGPELNTYQSTPFFLDGQTIPHVMLVLERDWKMFYPAYNNLADLDGDGALDIGFNPKVTYVGYFDSNSCYEYKRNGFRPNVSISDEKGYFVRAGETTPQTQAEANALAVSKGIDDTNLAYPASEHGVCGGGGNRSQGLGLWHGNWLNYALTSRMDAIRKVLYGGKRTTDSATQTVLEMVRVPANANVWGGEIYANDIWESYAPSSPWYDVEQFTGFSAPQAGTMHFWARGDYFWRTPIYTTTTPNPSTTSTNQSSATKNSKPLFRFVSNVPSTNRHPFLKVPLRIWDWTGDHSSYNGIPSDGHLANSKNASGVTQNNFLAGGTNSSTVAWNFAARVEVCQAGNISPTEGCRNYQGNYKPIGLLQEYGESSRMFFGLLTGTVSHPSPYGINSGTRYKGGVVRHHIQEFRNYVNSNGTIVRPGLINTMDVFEITGVGSDRAYSDGSQAGNPLGEMVWEAVRYLGGGTKGLNPTTTYGASGSESSVTSVNDSRFSLTKLSNWSSRPTLDGNANDCPKPIILAISEVFPDHDGDDYTNLTDLNYAPRSAFASGASSKVPTGAFSINAYLDVITQQEELNTAANGKQFFYPDSRGLCAAKPLDGLSLIKGHCPSEPSLEGTYNLAAVAYYAHTHDFTLPAGKNDDGTPKIKEANIDFYAVGIAGNFPDITLTVSETESLTLMPIALTAPLDASSSRTEGESDPAFRTLLNFFIEYWQTDDGHSYTEKDVNGVEITKFRKVPYKVKFRTNFEFTVYPCYVYGGNSNNWERDLFNAFTISLLTGRSTQAKYREPEPLYINSGPFKTLNKTLYRTQRDNYRKEVARVVGLGGKAEDVNADSYFLETGNQKYYYAFKRTKGETLDISQHTVVGVTVHSDSTGSGYGASGQTGYTITGVQHPGAYLDVGLNRSDYPVYYSSGSACQPSKTQFVPNPIASCGDEEVPLDPSGTGLPGAQWRYDVNGTHNTPANFNNHRSGTSVYTNNADCGYYHPPTMRDDLLTPAECPYAGYSENDTWHPTDDADLIAAYNPRPKAENVCGKWAAGYSGPLTSKSYPSATASEGNLFHTSLMRYVQVRSFKFDTNVDRPENLPNPMWLAAKYGGFNDADNNGVPNRASEWRRGGSGIGADDPYNYFGVANMSELPIQLGKAFEAIANSVATGTANAASISQVLGGGISLQTQYRTSYDDGSQKIIWGGTTYAFFIDKWGNLRADTNKNGKLDLKTNPANQSDWDLFNPNKPIPPGYEEQGDLIVHLVAPAGTGLPTVYLCRDPAGDNNNGNPLPTDAGMHPSDGGYPPYSACDKKDSLDEVKALWNVAQQISDMNVNSRSLYTYLGDKKGDGTAWSSPVDFTSENFSSTTGNLAKLHFYMGQVNTTETTNLIQYVRGTDFPGKYRSRTARLPWDDSGATAKVWRMGDVINSRPVIVGEPSSNYHLLFGDASYYTYQSNQARRRQVAYFGSNDGILHAANVGFFGALADGQAGYSDVRNTGDTPKYALGAEMWGYIPPSLLPHLQWMANDAYQHSYYVDLKPYIFDVKDGSNWRTIMVVGLRLGGAPIELVNGDSNTPYTTPEFFAMDVTDPEAPRLLWRYSDPTLGQSTAQPTLVRSGFNDKWYILLPSGPVQMKNDLPEFDKASQLYAGRSSQRAKVVVLDILNGEYARNRDKNPSSAIGNDPLVAEEPNSFFNDSYVPKAQNAKTVGGVTTWGHHVAYLSLASIRTSDERDSGAVYRVQMVNPTTGAHLPPDDWKLTRFYKTDKPVTAAMNSSYDQVGNLWVFFGTGRIWSKEDMTPCGLGTIEPVCKECYDQYLFGVKEPLSSDGEMTFAEVPQDVDIIDVSGIQVYANGDLEPTTNNTGKDKYEAHYYNMVGKTSSGAPLVKGYKWKIETWRRDLNNYDAGAGGYINPHPASFELINTQVKVDTLANGRLNATVTTYVPSANICEPLGESYIIVYDAFAGLPAPYMDVYGGIQGNEIEVTSGGGGGTTTKYQEVTGVKRVGAGMASEVAIRKTESGTRYEAVGFAGQRVGFDIPGGQSVGPGFISWREVLDMRFDLKEGTDALFNDLKP